MSDKAPKGEVESQNIDPNAILMALRQSEERVSELTDLVSRLNRALRGLEEQNQILGAQLEQVQKNTSK